MYTLQALKFRCQNWTQEEILNSLYTNIYIQEPIPNIRISKSPSFENVHRLMLHKAQTKHKPQITSLMI